MDRVEALPRRAIDGIGRLISSDIITYNEIDPQRQLVLSSEVPADTIAPMQVAAFERHTDQHPLITHYAQTRDSRPLKISDFLTLSQFRRLDLYNEFFGELAINYQIAITIPSSPALVIGIALNRRRRDFSERDRALLDLIRPHLAQAYRLIAERARLRQRAEQAEQAIWSTPPGNLDGLTRREHDVLILVAEGKTNPQIGDRLRLSARTVQKHLEHMYEKLGVRTRTEAAMKLQRR